MNKTTLQQLRDIVGSEYVSATEADRALHSQDQSTHPPVLPDVVIWPNSTAEAIKVMHTIKQALDPLNILNPGKVLPIDSA